jgi:hypothetical protein
LEGHIASSLEHEIWQELTGYDAVSTVRGIQMALAGSATLVNPKKNSTVDTLPELYASFGFNATVPTGFTFTPFSNFTTAPATWKHTVDGTSFQTLLGTVTTASNQLQKNAASYSYFATKGLYGWSKCVFDKIASVNASISATITGQTCDGTAYSGSKAAVLNFINQNWANVIIPTKISQVVNYLHR